jgi:hypothetical protein
MGIGFHKFSGLSILILQLLGSHEALCFIKLVISRYVLTNTVRREEQLLYPAVLSQITKKKKLLLVFMCAPCTVHRAPFTVHRAPIVSKTLFIVPNDAHYYKIIEM